MPVKTEDLLQAAIASLANVLGHFCSLVQSITLPKTANVRLVCLTKKFSFPGPFPKLQEGGGWPLLMHLCTEWESWANAQQGVHFLLPLVLPRFTCMYGYLGSSESFDFCAMGNQVNFTVQKADSEPVLYLLGQLGMKGKFSNNIKIYGTPNNSTVFSGCWSNVGNSLG